MGRIEVKLTITDQDVRDILWLMFDRSEFENPESVTQSGLQRLKDYGMLDDRIAYFQSGLAHCYFVAKEDNGERKLEQYLDKMQNSEKEILDELDSSFSA